MPGANWYRDGTVTATNSSKTVVGSGTIWSVQAKTGDLFALLSDGGIVKFYEIDAVTDNTHLTLKDEFAETTAEAAEYAIVRNFNTTMTSETNAQLVSFLREWKLALQNNLKGDTGDPGADGRTIYSNNGAPAAGLGVDDDWCIDYSTWNMYRKESGTWTLRGNIKGDTGAAGAAGAKWYSSASDPSSAIGVTGDYALNTTSGDVFKRGAGGWTLEGNLKGATGATGAQGPQGATGATGATGTAGSRWHTVTGVPSTALGVNTDMALDTATGNWYQKESGAWGLKGNIKGPTGATGAQGIPGVTWKGEWSAATEYVERDAAYYNGNSYIALQPGTNQTPPATSDSYWQIVARKGTDGEGAGDMLKIDYDSNADGKVNAADAADTATYATNAGRATVADSADAVAWEDVSSKPSSFTPSAHTLDAHTAVTLAELNAIISDADLGPAYALPTASADTLGGIKVAVPVTVTDGVLGVSAATTSAAGLMSSADKAKLDGLLPLWTSAGNVTTTSTTGFSVTDNATNQAIYAPGRPLKVGSTYQIVASYTTGAVVLTGAALIDATEYAVEFGDFTRLQKVDINLPGAFAAAATTTAIKTLTGDPLYWDAGPAELVAIKHLIQSEDSAATTTQPAINVSIDGTDALASDSETATTRTVVGCGLAATYGQAIELKVVKATGGTPKDDAESLSVTLLFVTR